MMVQKECKFIAACAMLRVRRFLQHRFGRLPSNSDNYKHETH